MLAWEIMTCQVHTTCPEEHLAMAALIFAKREVSNMPVLDKDHFRDIGFCYGTYRSEVALAGAIRSIIELWELLRLEEE